MLAIYELFKEDSSFQTSLNAVDISNAKTKIPLKDLCKILPFVMKPKLEHLQLSLTDRKEDLSYFSKMEPSLKIIQIEDVNKTFSRLHLPRKLLKIVFNHGSTLTILLLSWRRAYNPLGPIIDNCPQLRLLEVAGELHDSPYSGAVKPLEHIEHINICHAANFYRYEL